jgi:type II secretion system protein D
MKGKKGEAVTDKPVVITDARSNALVIASNKEDYIAIEALVKQLEDQPLAPSSEIHIEVLKHNDASKLGPQLQDLFKQRAQMRLAKGQEEQPSERIAVVADATTNTLLIASGRENYDEIVGLLSKLDIPLDVAGVVRLFPLQHVDATLAAKLIEDLFQKGIQHGAGAPGAAVPESQKKVSIVTDTRTNALIVSATPENFSIVETLLKQIDTSEQPSIITPESRIFQIRYADAVKLADMLTKLLDGLKKSLPEPDASQLNMTFLADDRSNTVIATGSRFGMRRTQELVEKIDRAPGIPSGEPKVYALKYATASKLAQMLTDLFEKKKPSGGQSVRTPVYILADEGSNSLIITAPIEEHSTVTGLLQMLDRPSTLSQLMEIIPLQKAKAEDLADTMTKLLEKQQTGATKGTPFSIAAEPRTNSLIVFAGPDMMSNIRIIAEKLDTTQPIMELGLRVITLKQAKAEDLAKRLTDFLKGASAGGTAGGGKAGLSSIISFKSFDEATQKEVLRKLVQQDITITADARTNSLLVLAPADSADMLATLIETLDAVRPITAEIQMFLLRNADAEETKTLLDELFQTGTKGGGGGAQGQPERRLEIAGAVGAAAATAAGAAGAAAVELAFSVDKRTNTLIAAGSPEYLEIAAQVVDRLDSLDLQNRVQRIVKLRNGVAEDVAKTMESYFKAEQQALQVKGAEESVITQLERQVTVQADKASNTIILSYNRRMESQIVEMINKLDQQPPQVMIQVLLAEVTLDNSLELGMEFALQDLQFTENATVGPNNTIEAGRHFDVVAGTDVGAAGSGTGFSFTITGEDFNFLFHALQGDSRIDVLSRPSIMVADNEKANITVGTRVPVVQNVTVSTGGIVVPSVTYEKVGILLDVEPHINPDGFVNLSVKPTISDLGTSTVSVGSGINLPTFLERSAETVVTVRDGETIVIGGLIRTSDTTSENKMPITGDIPILGNLFRATKRARQKTELLIVLTPKVIRTEEEAHEISVKQRDQSGLLEKIRSSPLMDKLQVKPGEEGLGPPELAPSSQPAAPGAPGAGQKPIQYGPPLNVYGPETNAVERPGDAGLAEVAEGDDKIGARNNETVDRVP